MRTLLAVTTVLATSALWASAPANAVPLVADGVTYSLVEAPTGDPLTDRFTLTISGENTASDTEGGRTGINAIAFTEPAAGVTGAVMITPPTGYVFVSGGLNSTGCDASGNFYCFDNTTIPPTPGSLLSGPITFVFDVTVPAGGTFTGYAPDFKIDWVGTANNYDLVSLPITPTTTVNPPPPPPPPIAEPSSIALLGLGLLGLGAVTATRRR